MILHRLQKKYTKAYHKGNGEKFLAEVEKDGYLE